MRKDLKAVSLCLLVPLIGSGPSTALAGESVDQHWDVSANALVAVDNPAGVIEIHGWDRNEVQLTGKLGDSVKKLESNQSGSGLQITVVNRDERDIDKTLLVLKVPATATLEAVTVSADIEISAINNEKLTVTSVSGDVEVQASSAWASLDSVSGDVSFRGGTARISAESVSGDLRLSGIAGELEATTVSGDMVLSADAVESGKLETVSGDIRLTGSVSGSGRLSAESMSGDVSIRLPDTQQGLFKAQSFSGRIRTDFGTVERARHGPGSSLKYAAGESLAEIRVESFSGDISLRNN